MIHVNRGPAPTDTPAFPAGARRVATTNALLEEEARIASAAYGLPEDALLGLLHRAAAPRRPHSTWTRAARQLGQPGRYYLLLLTTPFRNRHRSVVHLSSTPLASVLYRNLGRAPRTNRWLLRAVAGPFASERVARELRVRLERFDSHEERLEALRADPRAPVLLVPDPA